MNIKKLKTWGECAQHFPFDAGSDRSDVCNAFYRAYSCFYLRLSYTLTLTLEAVNVEYYVLTYDGVVLSVYVI